MSKPKLIKLNVSVFAITGLLTLVAVPLYAYLVGFDGTQVAAMLIGIVLCEISITAGYHRLWSHRAYDAHWLVRLAFALGGTFATQNTILHWSSDHRRHHRFVDDNKKDPYSAGRGFWYSHIGWMLRDYSNVRDADSKQYDNCRDLQQDAIVMWQHRHYMPLVLGLNFGIPVLFGLWHGDLLGALLLLGVARLAISHHLTFFINSLAHIWGKQPYSDANTSRDNGFIALLTMGEGYHNYHHHFQRDYRNGIRWWQFDPTKWLIRSLAFIGLTRNLYRTPLERIEAARAQMLLSITSRKLAMHPQAEAMILRAHHEYELLIGKINAFSKARKQWLEASKASLIESYDVKALRDKAESLRSAFLQQKKAWLTFNATISARITAA
jgi:stearoyl-CoA desaturase (delta-9 desaturase)